MKDKRKIFQNFTIVMIVAILGLMLLIIVGSGVGEISYPHS